MRFLTTLTILILASIPIGKAQSKLLESVKRNPQEAKALCDKFKSMNSQRISALSPESINEIAKERNLSAMDAEILTTYVIGLNCPEVR